MRITMVLPSQGHVNFNEISAGLEKECLSLGHQITRVLWAEDRTGTMDALPIRKAILASAPERVIAFGRKLNPLTLMSLAGSQVPIIAAEEGGPTPQGFLTRPAYRRARQVVVPTEEARASFSFLPAEKVAVILRPFDPTLVSTAATSSMERRTVILFVSPLDKGHFVESLIHSMQFIAPRHPEWKLQIMGEGPTKESFQSMVDSLGVTKNVEFSDPRQFAAQLRTAGICVLSSEFEGSRTMLGDAMASGLPVVAAESGESREMIQTSNDAFRVSPDDIEAVTSVLERLITHPDERKRMGENAQQAISRRRSSEIYRQWAKVLT